MSSRTTIGTVLFGKTQRVLLSLFFLNPDSAYYLRQIARMTGVGVGAAQRELTRWAKAGILVREKQGMQVNYKTNKDSPIFAELQSIVIKTVGVADCIREALLRHRDKILQSYIYGSFARGTQNISSDIDLMIVGSLGFGETVETLSEAQSILGREINPTVYNKEDYKTRLKAGNHFLTSLTREPKIWLIGETNEFN